MGRAWKWVGGVAATLLLLVVVFVAIFDWNWLRGEAGRRASGLTGRDVAITGDLDVDLGWTTRIRATGITVANAPWGSTPDMLEIGQAEVAVSVRDLLRGRLVLPEITLLRPDLLLEKNARGDNNWTFGGEAELAKEATLPEDRTEVPVIGRLAIDQGRLRYRDPAAGIDLDSQVTTATGTTEPREMIRLTGKGSFEQKPFRLNITGGSILSLREAERPYPLAVDIAVGRTKGNLRGTVTDPIQMTGLDLLLDIAGPDMAELFPIVGIPVPETPPYSLRGRLGRRGHTWSFSDFAGRVGDSDLTGDLEYETGGRRPFMRARLVSRNLDLEDLSGFIGAEPETEAERRARERREADERPGQVLPDRPVNLERLHAVDMDVHFAGTRIRTERLPITDMAVELRLERGLLNLAPLAFGVAGGKIAGSVVLDGRERIPGAAARLDVSNLRLPDFFRGTRLVDEMQGRFGGRIDLEGRGASTAALLANSSGKLAVVMGDGRFSNLVLELAGLDIAESLGFLLTEDRSVALRCLVTDFAVERGVMTSRLMLLDTTDTQIIGQGTIDLGSEALALRLEAHPKDPSALATRAPVLIDGTFADPQIGIDPTALAARGAAAAALGALLTPLAAILPFIELGLGEDSPCQSLIAKARRKEG